MTAHPTDPTPLQERLWEAIAEVRDQHPRVFNDAPTDDVVAAALPHIAAEVRAAKAEALREAVRDMGEWADEGIVVVGENDEDSWAELTVGEWLNDRATEYETGDQR